ncbi:hypothetical protein ABIF74_011673 [Bradyrhizobium japonicum]
MVALGPSGAVVLYRARTPVPVSMRQPRRTWFGESGSARATFFSDPVVDRRTPRGAADLLRAASDLAVLQSTLHLPDTIVAIASGWWATGTSVPAIQHADLEAWARLFGLPLVTAFNR